MKDVMNEDVAMMRAIKEIFNLDVGVAQIIAHKIPVSHTAQATLFLTSKKQLFLFITAQSKTLFGDIRKIVSKMGLQPESYIPPRGRVNYFDEVGLSKFHEVFPGRKSVSAQDIAFYKTLVPYNPALVLISEIKDSVVYQFDSNAVTSWRPAVKFAYRRIKTS